MNKNTLLYKADKYILPSRNTICDYAVLHLTFTHQQVFACGASGGGK